MAKEEVLLSGENTKNGWQKLRRPPATRYINKETFRPRLSDSCMGGAGERKGGKNKPPTGI